MKKVLKVFGIIILVLVLLIAGGFFYMSRGLAEGRNMVINEVNLASLENKSYIGRYEGGRWSNEVEVTVMENKIRKIVITKDVQFPMSEVSKKLFDEIIEKQSLNVDIVSGATVTCKAYLKSIENALK